MERGKGMRYVGDSRIKAERTPNLPKDYSEYPGRTEAFWPNFLLKEWLVGSVFLIGFLTLVAAHPAPLQGLADPSNAAYLPLPDWYFLFLYQLLKYKFASQDFTLFGILILPGLAFGGLLLAPFLDNGPGRRPKHRPIAVAMMLLALVSVMWLTYESAAPVDWKALAEENQPVHPDEFPFDASHDGYEVYKNNCSSCHGDALEGASGPTLIGIEHSQEDIADISVNGIGNMPADIFQGTDEELEQLSEFITIVNEENN